MFKFKLTIQLKIFLLTILSLNLNINSQSNFDDEQMRIRSALDILPRFKGKGYSNKMEIKYENNKFRCYTRTPITPKEYSFLSNSGHSICSDKIFENFEALAEMINSEIRINLEPKLSEKPNIKFLNDFKQVLYFAYYLAYLDFNGDKKIKKPSDNFYDTPKLSYTQSDIILNLQTENFNIFDITNEDIKILKNYLHRDYDFNIGEIRDLLLKILQKIEKTLSPKKEFNWIKSSRNNIKFFIGAVWRDAIHIDFE